MTSIRFRSKFKSYVDQYELREHHFYALLRTKEAENQLNLARMEDYRKRSESEMAKSRTLSTQVSTFSQTETELRNQLNIYVEKFKQACDPQVVLFPSFWSLHQPIVFTGQVDII